MQLTAYLNLWAAKAYNFYCQQRLYAVLLLALLAAAVLLRFYNLSGTLLFQADQGRDALVVRHLLTQGDLIFIGPVTSIGNMYLGPFYYYFMAPFLLLANFSPLGPAIGVALVNVLLVFFTYYWGRQMVGKTAAMWAAFFTCFSAVLVEYSRFSWNPNLSAFFSLASLYALFLSFQRSSKYWLWTAFLLGILLQLHYVNLIIALVAGVFWLVDCGRKYRQPQERRSSHFFYYSFLSAVIFFATTLPLLLFDIKNKGLNLQALSRIFFQEQGFTPHQGSNLWTILEAVTGKVAHLFIKLLFPGEAFLADLVPGWYWYLVGGGSLICLLFVGLLFSRRQSKYALGHAILAVSCLLAVLALAAYQHSVFNHYLLFFLPVLFLICGSLIAALKRWPTFYLWGGVFLGIIFLWANFNPHIYRPFTYGYRQVREVAAKLAASVPAGSTYSFVIQAHSRDTYGDYYRYFLEQQPAQILPLADLAKLDYLYVIDETKQIDLFNVPTYEIVIARNATSSVELVPTSLDWVDIYRFNLRGKNYE